MNQEIQTATITADFDNTELIKVHLEKPSEDYSFLYYLSVIILIVIFAYVLYKKLKTNKKTVPKHIIQSKPKQFDM